MLSTNEILLLRREPSFTGEEQSTIMKNESSELEGLRSLDPRTITSIHNRYYPEVYRFARYRIGNEHTAEDIAGEVFVRLLEASQSGHGPHTNLRGWLIGTTSNMVNDYFRKHYRRPVDELNENILSENNDPHMIVEANDERRRITDAIQQLTYEQQQVITLRFGNDYSLEETASIMGKNANAIKALQFRALSALRRVVQADKK
jgi:RNA polymerase sigma-70 factor (ECF subfamily)